MLQKLWKIIKRMLLIVFSLVALFILAVILFVNTAPQMGQKPEGADLTRIAQSPNYQKDRFVNIIPTQTGNLKDVFKVLPDFFYGKNQEPKAKLPVRFDDQFSAAPDSITTVTWFGHSAFLIQIQGKKLLIDPMLGKIAAPIPFGSKRFPYEKPIPMDQLKAIDAVIISHDHYDHLDYPSIQKIDAEVKHFFTPLGVGAHLKHWGVAAEKITELDWWEETTYEGLKLVAAPSRHFSGRGFTDRDATQWASWCIIGEHQRLYFSGDGGYGDHFKTIGERFGPFDFAMLECGQYNPAWGEIHMSPEESAQAGLDVKAKLAMPIHWGAFKLAVHTWVDPIDRFKAAGDEKGLKYIHPYIGERIELGSPYQNEEWWANLSALGKTE
ncbi:MAG: MBL fold metallo-hydrolase [Flammeovirgaceae bacterium]